MRKLTQSYGRQVKRSRYLDQIQKAEEAANAHNPYELYRIVRRLAPRQRYQTVQIRDEDNSIISHARELEQLRVHFTKVWSLPTNWKCPTLRSRSDVMSHMSLQEDIYVPQTDKLLVCASSIPPYKALPKTHPIAPAFRAVADLLGQKVLSLLGREFRKQMPGSWNLTHVALIPKPGKKVGAISSLRPIGLQDPVAKCYVKVLADDLKPYAMTYLRRIPQHAYLAYRSTYTAIVQAFDTAPWALLEQALNRTAAPSDLKGRIMEWITGTTYVLEHRGSRVNIPAERGVRQGCVLSPLLWSLFTGLIYEEFQYIVQGSGLSPDIVFFADDKHLGWLLRKPQELALALEQFGKFLSLLRSFGLQANPTKSKAILSMRGSMSQSLRRLWVSLYRGESWLRIPVGLSNEYIPLVQQIDYLGIVLSYGRFEDLSWKRRFGVSQASYERLRKILLGHHVLSLKHRIQLWRAVVLSSACYGLVGVEPIWL
ncbi:unnamed protein product [Symbiodinium sp. CCMP2592]|nr:unnamed protein product [Symbiodinium sp. CCMP2592]